MTPDPVLDIRELCMLPEQSQEKSKVELQLMDPGQNLGNEAKSYYL